MDLKGKHTFKVSREQLWIYLMDPEVLAKITPGVSKLKVTGENTFNTISDIKIGPVKGSFKGKLAVVDKEEPASFVIKMEQLSKIGNAHAEIQMNLAEAEDGHSALSFDGKARLSGMIARTGQRVLTGVANAVTKEVFASLEDHIAEQAETEPQTDANAPEKEVVEATAPQKAEEDVKEIVQENLNENVKTIEGQVAEVKEKVESIVTPKVEKNLTKALKNNTNVGFFQRIINFIKSIFGA